MDHTFETPDPVKLHVEIGSGRLDVTAAEVTTTTIVLSGPGAEETTVERDDDQVTVTGPRQRGGFLSRGDEHVDATITVPTDSQLMTRTGSADQHLQGRWRMVKARTGSGDVSIEHVTGPAVVESGSGEVELDVADGDLRVKSGSGDVAITQAGVSTVVSTGSGDIVLRRSAGSTVVKTGSGDITVVESHGDLDLSTASGDAAIEAQHRGSVKASSASGDVRVGVPSGVPVWTDVTTVSGRIHSDLEGAGQPGPGEDHLEIRARSVSGDVVLHQL
jgi:hypothetical protein